MKIYFDCEFSGLIKNTSLISIGIISENGDEFYAEFNDYDKSKIDKWLKNNIIDKLLFNNKDEYSKITTKKTYIKNNKKEVTKKLIKWLENFDDEIEIWSDTLAYDWVLFCDLFDGALNLPKYIYYIPFDIVTLLKVKDIDPDITREDYVKEYLNDDDLKNKHNSLFDAKIIKLIYEKIQKL